MNECNHAHKISSLNTAHWWCKDCGKGLTPGAKDRKLEISRDEIYHAMLKTMGGYASVQAIADHYRFADEIIKLCKGLYHGD